MQLHLYNKNIYAEYIYYTNLHSNFEIPVNELGGTYLNIGTYRRLYNNEHKTMQSVMSLKDNITFFLSSLTIKLTSKASSVQWGGEGSAERGRPTLTIPPVSETVELRRLLTPLQLLGILNAQRL